MILRRGASFLLALLLSGCIDETNPWWTGYVTEDPVPKEFLESLTLACKPGIFYEYPVWLNYNYGNDSWKAGYVWVSLSYLPLVPPFDRYRATPDTVRFSDLVEGVEPLPILLEKIVGVDSQRKTCWSEWVSVVGPNTRFTPQMGIELARIPVDYWELARRHVRHPGHAPLQVSLGDRNVWAIGTRVWAFGELLDTVELYPVNPAPAEQPPKPAAVWITARGLRPKGGGEVKWFTRDPQIPYVYDGRLYVLFKVERRPDGSLVAFEARPWEGLPVDPLLDGADSETCLPPRLKTSHMSEGAAQRMGELRVRLESSFNEKLIEWKAAELPKILTGSKPEELTKLSVRLEKALLKLDLKVRQLKDAVDEDARLTDPNAPRKAPARALDVAHLLDQRKTILTVILSSVKRAASSPQQ